MEWSLDSIEDEQAAIPPGGAPPVARHRWVIYGFGPCSATCGGGVQDRIVQCAKIEADGWTLADPRACVVDGAGESPPAQRACNVAPCDQPVVTPGEWGACSAACGGGVQERPVMCRATAGALLPRSSCLQVCSLSSLVHPPPQRCPWSVNNTRSKVSSSGSAITET